METNNLISRVRTFGALGYDPERIADILNLSTDQRLELIMRLSNPSDPITIAYEHGRAIGEYNIDVELTKLAEHGDIDSIALLALRSKDRKLKDMKKLLFGI